MNTSSPSTLTSHSMAVDSLSETAYFDTALLEEIETASNSLLEQLATIEVSDQLVDVEIKLASLLERLTDIEDDSTSSHTQSFITCILEKLARAEKALALLRKKEGMKRYRAFLRKQLEEVGSEEPWEPDHLDNWLIARSIESINSLDDSGVMRILTLAIQQVWSSTSSELPSASLEIDVVSDVLQPLIIPRGDKHDTTKISPQDESLLVPCFYGSQIQQMAEAR